MVDIQGVYILACKRILPNAQFWRSYYMLKNTPDPRLYRLYFPRASGSIGFPVGGCKGVVDNAHLPLDPLFVPPCAEHGNNCGGREPTPPPLPVPWHVRTLGGAEPLPPCNSPLRIGIGEEEKLSAGRGGSGKGQQRRSGLMTVHWKRCHRLSTWDAS